MTNSEDLPRTYATLRFIGDRLDPDAIARIMPVPAKRAHRKGEMFRGGPRSGLLSGRTGIWYFDTRDLPSKDLGDHLSRVIDLIYPKPGGAERLAALRQVLDQQHACAEVSCFWFGAGGMRPPTIPEEVRSVLAKLPAPIETNFQTAETETVLG